MADCGCGNKLQIGFSGSKCSECSGSKGCGDVIKESPCLSKEVVDIVVDIWDDPGCAGDNVVRVFNKDECVYHDGYFYWSLEDMNVDMPPSAKWSEGSTKCEMLKPSASLLSCSGTEHLDGARVPSCAEMAAADQAIIDTIPAPYSLNDCAGNVIPKGTEVVKCSEFQEKFQELLDAACFTMQDLGNSCGEKVTVKGISCGDGKYRWGFVSEATAQYGVGGFDNFDTCGLDEQVWPVDPDDITSYMTYQEANNKLVAASGVFADLPQEDQDKLDAARLFCATHDAQCDETINFEMDATVKDTNEDLTSTQFIYSINGVFNVNNNNLKGFASFNNKTKEFQDNVSFPVPAGNNVVCVYAVRQDVNRKMTQFNVRNCNGTQSPRWRITQAGV